MGARAKVLCWLLWGSFQCLEHDDDLNLENMHAAVRYAPFVGESDEYDLRWDKSQSAVRSRAYQ